MSVVETGEMLRGTPPTSVVFAANSDTATLVVQTVDDDMDEDDSVITATITVPPGFQTSDRQLLATATVMDNDYSDTEMCTGSTAVNGFEGAGLIKDCNTLLGLKGTLEGSGGVELDWDVDTSMSEWEGITVGGTPSRVTNLSLSSRSLYGSIPAALGDLTELTHLDLSANFFTTSKIPKELNDLTKLTYLSFDNCINCPSSEIPYLGGLTNLTELHLHANAYTGNFPEWLGKLTKLTHVELWGTAGRDPEDSDGVGLTGPIPDLSGLTELTYLSLNKTPSPARFPI